MGFRRSYILLAIPALAILGILFYNLPPVKERLEWRVSALRSEIKYAFSPPEETVFLPEESNEDTARQIALMVTATLQALLPSPTPTSLPTLTPTLPASTSTPTQIPTPTITPTPIPENVILTGITHEYQKWNNCGPANLAMLLTFWDWVGDQRDTAAVLKPNPRDKNVMPQEMAGYVRTQTGLDAIVRVGGDLEIIKRLIAAGYPVIVEKGLELPGLDGWVGHYLLISGYDESRGRFITQDSYIQADFPLPYEEMNFQWQSFNYTYIVAFPPEREAEVLGILGSHADETLNFQYAAEKAAVEIENMEGRQRYFAWFNRGSSLAALRDYAGAAKAYDNAFAIYATLDPEERPWRILWYQVGAYEAYFGAGRFRDLIHLVSTTISSAGEPALEESFYWRALAKEALGDFDGAIEDLEQALQWNENFVAGREALERIKGNNS